MDGPFCPGGETSTEDHGPNAAFRVALPHATPLTRGADLVRIGGLLLGWASDAQLSVVAAARHGKTRTQTCLARSGRRDPGGVQSV